MRKAFIRPKKVKEMRKQEQLHKQSERKLKERTENVKVYPNLQDNVTFVGTTLGDSGDLITRKFKIPYNPTREAAIMYFDGMADFAIVDEFILHSLTVEPEKVDEKYKIVQWLEDRLLHIGETKRSRNMEDMLAALLYGDTILYVDGCEEGFILGTKGWKHRGVEEPNIEAVVRGSREGLTENIRVNSALIRRRLKDPDLRLISYTLGKRTKTSVAVLYIEGIMDEKTLDEIKKRIEDISIDGVLESGYIEEFIEDNTWSPFPQVQGTERPDACVAHLLEGKAVILVDGTPFSLIVPAVFSQFYCSPEDYYSRFLISSLVRGIRFISFFIALLLPAFYIAFVSFHTEMIPSKLSIAIAAGRSTVPFPSVIEALLMEISVEILRKRASASGSDRSDHWDCRCPCHRRIGCSRRHCQSPDGHCRRPDDDRVLCQSKLYGGDCDSHFALSAHDRRSYSGTVRRDARIDPDSVTPGEIEVIWRAVLVAHNPV